jgi:hypothetical protein
VPNKTGKDCFSRLENKKKTKNGTHQKQMKKKKKTIIADRRTQAQRSSVMHSFCTE